MISLANGLVDLPWWGYVLTVIAVGQVTFMAITMYLHRDKTHQSIEIHPFLAHIFRFWLWLTTGMKTQSWVAIHRKHHAKCETEDDPHSPRIFGIRKVLFQGAELYREAEGTQEVIDNYGHGMPDDWVERKIYGHPTVNMLGVGILFIIYFVLFGFIGITTWAMQMIWTPWHAAGGINGIGHYFGYRNYETTDDATNIYPFAIWVAGEELHNNHHAYPSSAKFSIKPWEFDIGWLYIRVFEFFGLVKVKKVAPKPFIDAAKDSMDIETVKAIVRSRMHVMANYANNVIKPVLQQECAQLEAASSRALKRAKQLLILDQARVPAKDRGRLDDALNSNKTINKVYEFRQKLQTVWNSTYASQEKLLQAMKEWCYQAEQSGISSLQEFAASLKGYTLSKA